MSTVKLTAVQKSMLGIVQAYTAWPRNASDWASLECELSGVATTKANIERRFYAILDLAGMGLIAESNNGTFHAHKSGN